MPDAIAVSCPRCGAPMRRRTARSGPHAGSSFWGCSTYPRCNAIVNDEDAPESDAAIETSGRPPATPDGTLRRRTEWRAYGDRPGWAVRYAAMGGRLRAWDPTVDAADPSQCAASLCQAAIFTSGRRARGERGSRTLESFHRVLARGDRPPVDPDIERAILERAGLAASLVPSPLRGDLGLRLDPRAELPPLADVTRAVLWREPFLLDRDARTADGRPLVHPDAEGPWITERLPAVGGPAAGQWFSAQASLEALAGTGVDTGDARRVDFVAAVPGRAPSVIEIDGRQHAGSSASDATRDALLAAAGIRVIRIPASEVQAGAGDGAGAVASAVGALPDRPPGDDVVLLAWGATVGARVSRAICELLDAGWISGASWAIEIDEPLGIAVPATVATLELLAALDAVWNEHVAPDVVHLRVAGHHCRLARAGTGYSVEDEYWRGSIEAIVRVEPFRGPFHVLPPVGPTPQVVIRSVSLPVDLVEPHLEGGRRQTVPDADGIPRWALLRILKAVFGKRLFLPDNEADPRGQERAIRRLLAGHDTVVLLPTGAGKSLIYQFAGLILPGRTLVIDPLVSLIEDQLEGLAAYGIDRAIGITSADTAAGRTEQKLDLVARGHALFCLVAPERLQQRAFRDAIRTLTSAAPINLCVVDEAHCVSEWGHQFKPAYLDLGRVLRTVGRDTSGVAPALLALTGTASRVVLRDMLIELAIDRTDPAAIVTPADFDRPELSFEIVQAEPEELMPRLIGTLRSLPRRFGASEEEFFRPRGELSHAGIVFCQTKTRERGVFTVKDELERVLRIPVGFYAGSWVRGSHVQPVAWDEAKRSNARRFKRNELTMFSATNAYGMGIDKPNVRFIVHLGVPGSIEAYYQEAGRAGRDGRPATCVVVHDRSDRGFHDWALDGTFRGVDADAATLAEVLGEVGAIGARRWVGIDRGDDDTAEARERAIHRLRLLGVVDEYLIDFAARAFDVLLRETSTAETDRCLLEFVRRSAPGRVRAIERDLGHARPDDLGARVLDDARRLIAFIYDSIVASRRRALEEMVRLADTATDDADVRGAILSYLELGRVAADLEALIDIEPFSFTPWQELYEGLETLDDARDLRGATARLLESAPDNPGLLLGRGLAEAMMPDGDRALFARSLADALQAAERRFAVDRDELARVLDWLATWTHERRPGLAALVYLAAETCLGPRHLEYLAEPERRAVADLHLAEPDELGVVLARRIDRHAARLLVAAATLEEELT